MTAKISPMTKSNARNWYEIKNAASDTAEVFIYDQIGENWLGEGVTAKAFITELNSITAPNIDLHLNSPGGSVFDGVAIFNALTRHQATVTTYIDGLAASIASIIALAGERVVMASNALFMIHNPYAMVMGTAEDMRKEAEVLDKIRDTLVGTYQEKTGMSREDLIAAIDAETWYTAKEAQAAGFVDAVGSERRIAAHFDLAAFNFKHTPEIKMEAEPEQLDTAEPSEDSETAGAVDSAASDGASDTPTPEAKTETFVAGVGFVTFK